jgi:ubiquitin thioesterase OTU1
MIKVKLPTGATTKVVLKDIVTVGDFVENMSKSQPLDGESLQISCGYPPKLVENASLDQPLAEIGVASGSLIHLTFGSPSSILTAPSTPMTACDTEPSMPEFTAASSELVNQLRSLGYQQSTCESAVEIAKDDFELALEVCQSMEPGNGIMVPQASAQNSTLVPSVDVISASDSAGKMVRRIVKADNSCLFNAIAYLIHKDKTSMANMYRQECADGVMDDPITYSPEILGKSTEAYATWILDHQNWGGEIEMNVLSQCLKTEIAAVDIQSGNLYVYGSDCGYRNRGYLLYDGIHYDVIAQANSPDSPERNDVTLFSPSDTVIVGNVKALAKELRDVRKFTDTSKFSIRCMECNAALVGQNDAMEHAAKTGHQNFGQL